MPLVRLGDPSTFTTAQAAARGAAPAGAAEAEARPSGITLLPKSSPSLARAPPAPKRTFAHAGGKLHVSYPAGYDPATRSFAAPAARAGGAAPPIAARLGASSEAEAARKQKRAARFGGAEAAAEAEAEAGAEAAEAAEGEESYEARYAAAAKEQARLRAEFQARRLARAEAEAAPAPARATRAGRGGGRGGQGGRAGGALSAEQRLDISLDELRAKRGRTRT